MSSNLIFGWQAVLGSEPSGVWHCSSLVGLPSCKYKDGTIHTWTLGKNCILELYFMFRVISTWAGPWIGGGIISRETKNANRGYKFSFSLLYYFLRLPSPFCWSIFPICDVLKIVYTFRSQHKICKFTKQSLIISYKHMWVWKKEEQR